MFNLDSLAEIGTLETLVLKVGEVTTSRILPKLYKNVDLKWVNDEGEVIKWMAWVAGKMEFRPKEEDIGTYTQYFRISLKGKIAQT